jgi:hypothetical protein
MLFEVEINYKGNQLLVMVKRQLTFSLFGMPSASIVSKILEKWSTIIDYARD